MIFLAGFGFAAGFTDFSTITNDGESLWKTHTEDMPGCLKTVYQSMSTFLVIALLAVIFDTLIVLDHERSEYKTKGEILRAVVAGISFVMYFLVTIISLTLYYTGLSGCDYTSGGEFGIAHIFISIAMIMTLVNMIRAIHKSRQKDADYRFNVFF